ncbi:MAG: VOC family protein [Alphaproteobacteria bacterium]|nr:VOC family protein [Alphaproteobacteria bacterium]
MDQRISIITLGVADLKKARKFYVDGLGFKPSPASQEGIVFIPMGCMALALFNHDALAEDATVPPGGGGFRGVTLAYNTRTKEEVDQIMKLAVKAGGRAMRPAAEANWGGYAGYFADPDGHLWEVAWNPSFQLGKNGELLLPDGSPKTRLGAG